jgi:hypothetical protein
MRTRRFLADRVPSTPSDTFCAKLYILCQVVHSVPSGISFLQQLSYPCNVDIRSYSVIRWVEGSNSLFCRGKRTRFITLALILLGRMQLLSIDRSSAEAQGQGCSRFHRPHVRTLQLSAGTFVPGRWFRLPLRLPALLALHNSTSLSLSPYVWLYSVCELVRSVATALPQGETYSRHASTGGGDNAIMLSPENLNRRLRHAYSQE